jgi:hypothetical protein
MTFHVLGTVNRCPRYETVVSDVEDVEAAWAVPSEPRVSVIATVAAA